MWHVPITATACRDRAFPSWVGVGAMCGSPSRISTRSGAVPGATSWATSSKAPEVVGHDRRVGCRRPHRFGTSRVAPPAGDPDREPAYWPRGAA